MLHLCIVPTTRVKGDPQRPRDSYHKRLKSVLDAGGVNAGDDVLDSLGGALYTSAGEFSTALADDEIGRLIDEGC
jgi:hypothetical protein